MPLDKEAANADSIEAGYDPFAIDPVLQQAYDAFTAAMGPQPRRLREWLMPYLCWRYQVRDTYTKLPWVERASHGDRENLSNANNGFLADLALLESPVRSYVRDVVDLGPGIGPANNIRKHVQLESEAGEIADYIRKAAPVAPALANFFADYVHDSYGGFTLFAGVHEPAGYLRYRRQYMGNDTALTLNDRRGESGVRHA
ncbi:hypothetical protein JI752_010085 [Lysobacter sp. MMG2]|uniref:hypothetical protein n=1 Tax=Lysobacter sp. MMG2 TaxID=2801338 RepID=UPI001C23EF0B|nr:hypothetical protein [Lysobacter sp. MMG2]MBU8976485.1 hypothetical protein [Lysobacter sp. MMG2]